MAVRYTAKAGTFASGPPRVWLPIQLVFSRFSSVNYDLAPDGKRIVGMLPLEGTEGQKPLTHLTFLLNFFDELQRKAPGKN